MIFALFLASPAFAQWGSQFNAKVNYFFTPSRLWELVLGALGAFLCRYRAPERNGWVAGAGVVAVSG